jgi:acyl-coenzyme A synthetase/AMP-(fatty) acid ligase
MICADNPDGILCDERECIRYRDLPELLDELHQVFCVHRLKAATCVGVPVENTVGCLLRILYFLAEGIRFYLLPGDSPVHQGMPAFCEWISTSGGVKRNPGYKERAMRVLPRVGLAFFSSSGTTGKPKYICYTQEQLLLNAGNCVKRFGLTPASRVLVPVPVSHMYGMAAGLLPALLSGAGVALIEKNNIIKLTEKRSAFQPTVTLVTPAVVRMMSLLKGKPGGSGSLFITAGEKIGRGAYQEFESTHGTLLNLYGCTELGAIGVSPGEGEARWDGLICALEGVEVRVAADTQQIECRHNAGFETYVDEWGIPCGDESCSDGWFATRDAGRMEGASCFKVLGRTDNCINRSGFLVSLDEVGTLVEDLCPEIRRAVVIESGEGIRGELTALYELYPGVSIGPETVRQRLREKINRHQLPDRFCFISEMPKLPSGKPDRTFLLQHYLELVKNKL